MDLRAFRVLRIRVPIRADQHLTESVWKYLSENPHSLRSVSVDLEKADALFGFTWMVNPHELQSFKYCLDAETLRGIGHGSIQVWVYAIMPRSFAMAKRLAGSRSKMGIKAYRPEKFLGNQSFQS